MPELNICLNDPDLNLSKKEKGVLLGMREKYKDLDPKEADRKVLIDYHKSLHDELNTLKDEAGFDRDEYTPVDNSKVISDINKQYDSDLVNADKETKKEIVRAKEEKTNLAKAKAEQDAITAKTYRESADRLRAQGDYEGANLLDQRADKLEGEKPFASEAKENYSKNIERLEKRQQEKGLTDQEQKKLDSQKMKIAVIEKFGKTQEELIQELKDKGLLKQHCD